MVKCEPVDAGVPFRASTGDLLGVHWRANGVSADFLVSDDTTRVLRVSFDRPCIVRLLDEMPLSTEDDGPMEGLVPDHFAYRVTGSAFANAQSPGWKVVMGPVTHWRLVTGGGCVDVLTAASPAFSIAYRSG